MNSIIIIIIANAMMPLSNVCGWDMTKQPATVAWHLTQTLNLNGRFVFASNEPGYVLFPRQAQENARERLQGTFGFRYSHLARFLHPGPLSLVVLIFLFCFFVCSVRTPHLLQSECHWQEELFTVHPTPYSLGHEISPLI